MPSALIAVPVPPLRPQEFRRLGTVLYEACGIRLHHGKEELVRSRLGRGSTFTVTLPIADEVVPPATSDTGAPDIVTVDADSERDRRIR